MDQASRYPLRNNSSKNLILVTDEQRNNVNTALTFESVQSSLANNDIILNVVVNATFICSDGTAALGLGQNGAGYVADSFGGFNTCEGASVNTAESTTEQDYVDLALSLDGAAWDLNVLRAGGRDAQSFVKALLDIKVDEIEKKFDILPLSDAVVESISYSESSINVVIKNRGLVDITSPLTIDLLDGEEAIVSLSINALLAGEQQTLTYAYTSANNVISAHITAQNVDECSIDNNQLESLEFSVEVKDSEGLTAAQSFALTVANQNQAPTIISTAPIVAPFGSEYRYQIAVNDPYSGEGLQYQLTEAPQGMAIDQYNGLITFTPSISQQGVHNVVIVVTDINGLTDTQNYQLTVDDSYIPLRFISEPSIRTIQSQTYLYQPEVQADQTAELSYQLVLSPEGMTLDNQTGEVTWLIPENAPGREYPLVLQVTDQFGNIDIQSYELYDPQAIPSLAWHDEP